MNWILTALVVLVEGLGLLSAVHAVFTVRTAQGTIAWVVGLVAFPYVALPLYWMFGSRRFDAYSRAMKRKVTDHQERLHDKRAEMLGYEVAREDLPGTGVSGLAAVAGDEFLGGNRLDLLVDGEATFGAVLAEVATARHCIYLQTYIMREDGLGRRLLEALAAKAAEGVEVCFLIDSLGSAGMRPAIIEKWRARGVRLATFCASSRWRDRWRLNFRNHRKNIIVDGRVGFVGGHNIGDEYLGLDPKFGRWRDTHVRVEGASAMQLQMVFTADWFFATGEVLAGRWQAPPPAAGATARALVLASGPSDDHERCTLFFLHTISMATRRLWIASPYFVPDEGIMQALMLAAIRGVDVRILQPLRPDEPLVWLASCALLAEMAHTNFHVHRFTGGFLHQKVLVVDDEFAAVGSANFDNRSFRLNFEITLAVPDRKFAAEVAAMMERDFAESIEVAPREEYAARPLPFRAAAQAARLLAPIL